jgi:predicted esterase
VPPTHLTRRDVDARPSGLILMLHGGQASSLAPVDDRSASWRRSSWMMGHIRERASRAGVSIWLLRYQHRGWNAQDGADPSPVVDVRWALDEVRRELHTLPVVLLGHSMGARAAVSVAGDPNVAGVVALAPWLPADEPVEGLAGKHLAAAHGRLDRITSYGETETFVRRAGAVADSTEMQDMGRVGHYMLRRIPQWNEFAVRTALGFLPGARTENGAGSNGQ